MIHGFILCEMFAIDVWICDFMENVCAAKWFSKSNIKIMYIERLFSGKELCISV